jgi:hypothetical protein
MFPKSHLVTAPPQTDPAGFDPEQQHEEIG